MPTVVERLATGRSDTLKRAGAGPWKLRAGAGAGASAGARRDHYGRGHGLRRPAPARIAPVFAPPPPPPHRPPPASRRTNALSALVLLDDLNLDLRFDFRVQPDGDVVLAERLDGFVQLDVALVDREVEVALVQTVGNVGR